MATLKDYATAYCAKDIDALMHVFVDGEGISLIGTGAMNFAEVEKQLKRFAADAGRYRMIAEGK